jgi:hypothetical protein
MSDEHLRARAPFVGDDFGYVGVPEVINSKLEVEGIVSEKLSTPRYNGSHGWDVCPHANGTCFFARDAEVFHRVCSVNYEEDCEIKYIQENGGIK